MNPPAIDTQTESDAARKSKHATVSLGHNSAKANQDTLSAPHVSGQLTTSFQNRSDLKTSKSNEDLIAGKPFNSDSQKSYLTSP